MESLKKFMEVVEEEDFVEGHEVLEDDWRVWKNEPKTREESYILKGLINGSTALALWKMGRYDGAKKVWETYIKYKPYIKSVPSSFTSDYKRASELLEKKYSQIIAPSEEV
jgi:hypothetical protein